MGADSGESERKQAGHLVSVQVGQPRMHGSDGQRDRDDLPWTGCWRTGFWKLPVSGPVDVHREGLEGDGQADLVHHGGPDKAVLAYSADHYEAWHREAVLTEISPGAFGENLTVQDLDENLVCVGDVWQVGSTVLQVSQPRQPCWKLARRWGRTDLPRRVIQTGRTGWYLRVLEPGTLQAGDSIRTIRRPQPQWTVARANRVMYRKPLQPQNHPTAERSEPDPPEASEPAAGPRRERQALAAVPELSAAWKQDLLG